MSLLGIIFINIYIPAHTQGFLPGEVVTLTQCVTDLLQRYPGDKFVLGGDFNLDRCRFPTQRFKPPVAKAIDDAFNVLLALDFQHHPKTSCATFYAPDGSPSMLDYFFVDQSIRMTPRGPQLRHHLQFQHLAIPVDLEFDFQCDPGRIYVRMMDKI